MVQSRVRVACFFACCAAAGGAGLAAAGCGRQALAPTGPARPDLVLVTIDTLRADRVGRGITPHLDRLAARGLHFTQARATAPLTLPSHVSMLTGALPPAHGVRENGVHAFGGSPPPVARLLEERGYLTAAFVAAYVLDRRFGLADGFEHYDDQIARDPRAVHRLEAERPANVVVDRASAWLRASSGASSAATTQPIFVWVHFYDPHAPYNGSYDADVTFADAQLGRLLQELTAVRRDPIVIVAGDHGESLGDHGEATHGMLAYDAALRVPLVVAGPGITPGRRDDPVSLIDVAPTLATFGGAPAPATAPGDPAATVAAWSLLDGPVRNRETYAETQYPRVAGWSPVYALTRDRWKLVVSREPELYDLGSDPAEQQNVAASRATIVAAMAARLETLRLPRRSREAEAGAPRADAPRPAPAGSAEKLRALGYVAAGSARAAPADAPNPARHIAAWGEFEAALAERGHGRSVARLRKLAEAFPDAPVFQSTYARTLSERGSADAALTIYRRAVARWPDDATLFHELAVAARAARRASEALRAEEAAIALEPTLPSAHNGIGLLMTDAGRHTDAAASFERATALDPTNAEYWTNLGNAHRASGRVERAAEAYRRASDIDPASADAANGLGVLLVQQRRASEAIPLFERAVAASPDFDEARLNLAIAFHESGQRDRAIAAYRDVIARAKPGSPSRRAAAALLRGLHQ